MRAEPGPPFTHTAGPARHYLTGLSMVQRHLTLAVHGALVACASLCHLAPVDTLEIERRRELWPPKWFFLVRNPWRSACRSTQVKIYTGLIASTDLWARDVYLFGNACIGRVWKQVRLPRLSLDACGSRPRPAALVSGISFIKCSGDDPSSALRWKKSTAWSTFKRSQESWLEAGNWIFAKKKKKDDRSRTTPFFSVEVNECQTLA